MKKNRLVTVDSRARISLSPAVAPPGTTYRVLLHNGIITLIPVEITDSVPFTPVPGVSYE